MAGLDGLVKIPELRKRILFTLTMLAVYRIGVHIPTPGVDAVSLQQQFESLQGTVFGIFNMFSGGALERFSIFALGVMPYISSSIIFSLLTVAWPYLAELQKEGESGRKKITQYTRYGTVLLCVIQGYGIATGLEQFANPPVVIDPGMAFRLMTIVTLTGGTIFLMWLGEQMTERGIGNGISLIIFAGIASAIPSAVGQTFGLWQNGEISTVKILLILAIILVTFFIIIFIERGQRRVPIQYAKRITGGGKTVGGQTSHMPLKINVSGVIPPIFASSLIMFPATVANFMPESKFMQSLSQSLQPGAMIYNILFVGLIVFFCFFYTGIQFKSDDVAENLKKQGGFVPGIRPGPPTAQYLDYVLTRITTGGAVYISAICVLPTMMTESMNVPFYFGGTSVLILVGVALDTVSQIETHLLSRNYEGFMKHTRIRGRTALS